MWLWNFAHGRTPVHVYELLGIVLLAVMAIIAIVHHRKQKKREEEYEEGAKAPSTSAESVKEAGEI